MKLIGSLSVAIALLLGLLYWQHTENQSLIQRAVSAEQTASQNQTVINTLQAQATQRAKAAAALASQQQQLRNQLHTQNQAIQRLERENEDYRKWANKPLPDAARRLRQRPAITGAADYQRYLSTARTLRPSGSSTQPERRPDG